MPDVCRRLYSTPTFICGRTAVSTYVFGCLISTFYISYLLLYSSVDAQRSLHTSLVASSLHSTYRTCFYTQHSSVDAQRSLHTSLVASSLHSTVHIVPASTSTPVCVASILRFSGPSLALFSRWQRVHGYTSLIRPRLHSYLHSTSTFSEHFRDSSILHHKHFRKLLWVLNNAICCG